MAKKPVVAKKRGKAGTTVKGGHGRAKKHAGSKPALELTNYLLESHPEFGN
ncbi:MAG TPA: hypothetical protein VNK23_16685 [Candidatus Dormibacteraeota bacterium]|nr:hypothetical protein [Candidatus Dormibacteraeota bacterium]